jgi:alkylation response protein AidB-like acyl-CoA dehydrogenase
MADTAAAPRGQLSVIPVVPDITGGRVEVADPIERARRLAPVIAAAADECERNGTLPPPLVELLTEAGLFWLLVPEEAGGGGEDIVTAIRVVEELSAADGSVGWTLMANMSVTGYCGGHCTDVAIDTLYLGPEKAIVAGMFAPMGRLRRVDGGVIAQGSYSFGSGTGHATWIGGGARGADGDAEMIFLVPRENVIFKGGWDVLGLIGTGSYDYQIPEQFVGDDFVVNRVGGVARRGQPTQRLGLQVIGSAGHAGVALGLARHAFEELTAILSAGKRRAGAEPVREQQLFRHEFALMEGKLTAARCFVLDAFGAALETVTRGDDYTELQYQRIRQATTLVTRVAYDAVEFAYQWSGSKGLREPGALGRIMRDMHAATQHVYIDSTTLVNAAPAILAAYAPRG